MLSSKSSMNIAIIGAGPAGLTLALCLSNHLNMKITIFDQDDDYRTKPTFDANRSYTIDITGHGAKVIEHLKLGKKVLYPSYKQILKFRIFTYRSV